LRKFLYNTEPIEEIMHRSNSYNERFSHEIRNPKYARRYIKSMLEDFDLLDVLRTIASKMGTTEFAEFVGERPQNINKFIQGERSPKRETLDKYLRPFGLETVLQVKEVA
jgi:DNA-binding phage protein